MSRCTFAGRFGLLLAGIAVFAAGCGGEPAENNGQQQGEGDPPSSTSATAPDGKKTGQQAGEASAEQQQAGSGGPRVVRPFNGKNFDGWSFAGRTERNFWKVGAPKLKPDNPERLIATGGGSAIVTTDIVGANIHTDREFGDVRIELEAMLAEGSNSGVYVMGEYELQLIDDPPKDPAEPGKMDHGAIARMAAPDQFVAPEPGEWQTITIVFRAPRFNGNGEKTADARFEKVTIDGKTVHEGVTVSQATLGGLTVEEHPKGPLMLQGAEGPAAFRNIRITPLE